MTKWVYSFGGGTAEGTAKMKNLLGGKGANLAEMSNLGVPVPAGFTQLFQHVHSLTFDETPDYDFLQALTWGLGTPSP